MSLKIRGLFFGMLESCCVGYLYDVALGKTKLLILLFDLVFLLIPFCPLFSVFFYSKNPSSAKL